MKTRPKILVIDDEPIVCESFTSILSNEGYKVDTRISPQEGLDCAISKNYNLVFLDLKMEGMDGIDLFHKLREKAPDLPVIVVTGYPSMETALECIKLRASDYIIKPFTPDDILKLTKQIIPEVSPLSKDVEAKLKERTVFQEWKPSGKPVLFHKTAWLQQGKDGTVRVGSQLPDFIADNIAEIMLPEVNDKVYQGLPLAGSLLNYKFSIMIPSPLSGKVIDVNHKLNANPTIIEENYFNECWIARIDPSDLEKDLAQIQKRNIVLLSKCAAEVEEYKHKLASMGYAVDYTDTVDKAITALRGEKDKVIFINAESFYDKGSVLIQILNREIPDAKIVIIGTPDSELEEVFRENKILYYCVNSLFNREITDILHSVFTSFKQDIEVLESTAISMLPQSISKIHLTNKQGKKVSMLIFGDLLYNNKGIGYLLISKLLEKSFPLEVTRSINRSRSGDPEGRQLAADEKEANDLIITFQAEDSGKIPGQIHKDVELCTNSAGSEVSMINISVQAKKTIKNENVVFNNHTTKAIAELLFNEMTSFGI